MNKILALIICWTALLPAAEAASFDCAKASTAVEKLICNSPTLSKQDDDLSQRYQALLGGTDADDRGSKTIEQRNWLRLIRNKCTSEACLTEAYGSRIKELSAADPFADKNITCEKMRKFPGRIFAGSPDLGSGSGSPIEVDYQCPESLASQAYLKRMAELAEAIRADNGPPECTGTIIHAQWRYYHFDLARAGFAPKYVQKGERDALTMKYFEQWSWLSPYNYDLHKEFMTEFNKALPLLAEQYRKQFGFTNEDANGKARDALMIIVYRASGAFPSSLIKNENKLLMLAHDDKAGVNDLKNELAKLPAGLPSKKQAYAALKVALYGNRSPEVITILLDYIGPIDDKLIEAGDESALFAALHNPQYVKLLLDKGEKIDYPNSFGKTALFYAIGFNDHELAKTLLQRGANPNHAYLSAHELELKSDTCGLSSTIKHTKRTPLMHAAQNSDVEMIKLLISGGARVQDVDETGASVLDYAVMGKKLENQEFLKTKGLSSSTR